jgi:hypothetical protein
MAVEVGVRGFVASSTQQVFLKLGLQRQQVSAECSYAIYLAAQSMLWDENRPLLILNSFCALL